MSHHHHSHLDQRLGAHGTVAQLLHDADAILAAYTVAPEDTSLSHHQIEELRAARKDVAKALKHVRLEAREPELV